MLPEHEKIVGCATCEVKGGAHGLSVSTGGQLLVVDSSG